MLALWVELGSILMVAWINEKAPIFPHERKMSGEGFFWPVWFIFLGLALLSVRRNGDGGDKLLNREQSEEWKGWMQFLFLMYHWAKVPEAYNLVRVLITAYVPVFEREV